MNTKARLFMVALSALGIGACSNSASDVVLTETVQAAPLTLAVQARGELQAVTSTPLNVPGQQWSNRQLAWVLADGSQVKKGELVARFSAQQSKQDLAAAKIDLQRNLIARAGKQAQLASAQGQLGVNLAQVASQLAIAVRYASAGLEALSRNKVLDAVQDKHFLTTKQGILEWRSDQSSERGKAELAVIGAKHATYELKAKQKRADLDALELRAPHAGILVLEADWSGQKPHVGSNLYAGRKFASLPDIDNMEVTLEVPQVQAHGIRVGDAVELHPLGAPQQKVSSKISWVAAAAQPRSRESPVKYLTMKVPVPAAAVSRYHWVPGERFSGRIILLDAKSSLSVPNLAINSRGDTTAVAVRVGSKVERRTVKLGVRGATRSQVLEGLHDGDTILLDAKAALKEPSA